MGSDIVRINKRRDKVELLTKYGMKWDSNKGEYYFDTFDNNGKPLKVYKYAAAESVIKECEVSLKRLKTDYIDLYQIHWPDVTTPVEETMEAVEKLIQQGKVRAAGVSNYDLSLTMKASESLDIVSNQVPYSRLRRDIEKDLLPWCSEHDISILAYSPLQRGLLTGKIKPGHKFGEGDSRPNMPHFSHGNIIKVNEFLSGIEPLAKEKNATIAQLVIAWTLAQKGITVALVGARNRKQVAENLEAGSIKLSDKEVDDITLKLNELKLDL